MPNELEQRGPHRRAIAHQMLEDPEHRKVEAGSDQHSEMCDASCSGARLDEGSRSSERYPALRLIEYGEVEADACEYPAGVAFQLAQQPRNWREHRNSNVAFRHNGKFHRFDTATAPHEARLFRFGHVLIPQT